MAVSAGTDVGGYRRGCRDVRRNRILIVDLDIGLARAGGEDLLAQDVRVPGVLGQLA